MTKEPARPEDIADFRRAVVRCARCARDLPNEKPRAIAKVVESDGQWRLDALAPRGRRAQASARSAPDARRRPAGIVTSAARTYHPDPEQYDRLPRVVSVSLSSPYPTLEEAKRRRNRRGVVSFQVAAVACNRHKPHRVGLECGEEELKRRALDAWARGKTVVYA